MFKQIEIKSNAFIYLVFDLFVMINSNEEPIRLLENYEIMDAAKTIFQGKSNCAQASMVSLLNSFDYASEAQIINSAYSLYGSGMGEGSICGTITGTLGAISFILTKKGASQDEIDSAGDEFRDRMKHYFHEIECYKLLAPYLDKNGQRIKDHPYASQKCQEVLIAAVQIGASIIKDHMI